MVAGLIRPMRCYRAKLLRAFPGLMVPAVGTVYGVSREVHYGPKVAIFNQTRRVGHVRVVAVLEDGRVRVEAIDGSIWAGDSLIQEGAR